MLGEILTSGIDKKTLQEMVEDGVRDAASIRATKFNLRDISLTIQPSRGQLDLSRSTLRSWLKNLKGNEDKVVLTLKEVFEGGSVYFNMLNIGSEGMPIGHRRALFQVMRLTIMNAFPNELVDFMSGRGTGIVSNSIGLKTTVERRAFIDNLRETIRMMNDDRRFHHFLNFLGRRAESEAYYYYDSPDLNGWLNRLLDVNSPLSQISKRFQTVIVDLSQLVPARYVVVGGTIIAGITAYFTARTVEASEVGNTTESDVPVYISITEEELQQQIERISSDKQLLLYEQNRDRQRNSNRPVF